MSELTSPAGGPRISWITDLVKGWNQFWFTPADPTMLGVMRICGGLIALYVHLVHGWNLQDFFGERAWLDLQTMNEARKEHPLEVLPLDWEEPKTIGLPDDPEERARVLNYSRRWGVDPRQTVIQGQFRWSIWYHVTDPDRMLAVHYCFLTIFALLVLGIWTRATSLLAWLAALSYIHRSPATLYGVDMMMNFTLLYLALGPSGDALSVDRWVKRWRQRRQAARHGWPLPSSLPHPSVSANVTLRLFQVHLCIIYLYSGLAKLQGGVWWNGTAVWMTLVNYEFSWVCHDWYAATMRFLTQHRWLWEIVVTGATIGTLVLEIGFPFLVWNRRLRWPMLLGALGLHLGIGLLMGLMTFSLMILTMALAFVPSETVRGFGAFLMRFGIRARDRNPRVESADGFEAKEAGYRFPWGWLATIGVALLAYQATPPNWDTARMMLRIFAALAGLGTVLTFLPPRPRHAVVSILILLHFTAILTAAIPIPSDESPMWITDQLARRIFWPYVELMYLDTPYSFYSPQPPAETLLWIRVEYADETSRWVRLPDYEKCRTKLELSRWLALTAYAGSQRQPPKNLEKLLQLREKAGERHRPRIPLAEVAFDQQYSEPTLEAKRFYESYARHAAYAFPHPIGPNVLVTGIKLYAVVHQLLTPREFKDGADPNDPTLFWAYYLGDFAPEGNLKASCYLVEYDHNGRAFERKRDPFLYWLIPIERGDDGTITDYVRIHAGDNN